jgi:molybdate transport system regulatory protein
MNNDNPLDIGTQRRRIPVPDAENSLDPFQLQKLEVSFRQWSASSNRADVRASRNRIFLIFLIIRYTGARLNEVLHLDLRRDFDCAHHTLRFKKKQGKKKPVCREVQIPEAVSAEIQQVMAKMIEEERAGLTFQIDPAHVRRKFYAQAEAIGLASRMGAPEIIRKSRAVELIRSSMPLQVVQKIMGHSTPNLAASYVEFLDSDLDEVAKYYAERESNRKTSARNSFFGKISGLQQGDIQTFVEITSLSGNIINSIITNSSMARLGLKPGMLITAEVKAPLIQICKSATEPNCSAENIFQGTVLKITGNSTLVEVIVQIADGTELCAIISERKKRALHLKKNDQLWVFFDAFTVVLHAD